MRRQTILLTLLPALAVAAGIALLSQSSDLEPAPGRLTSAGSVTRSLSGAAGKGEVRARLRHLQIHERGPGLYEVDASDVQALLDNASGILSDVSVTIQPMLSLGSGPQYRISSDAVDGIVTAEGFVVTDPKLSRWAGIEPGDTILSVGGYPVSAFQAMVLALRRDPDRSTFVVEIDRSGTRITQTYRVR